MRPAVSSEVEKHLERVRNTNKGLPQMQTISGMINELYAKEKKYVKQYFREDYLGKNDFIFDLGKSHTVNMAKKVTEPVTPERKTRKNIFINGINL